IAPAVSMSLTVLGSSDQVRATTFTSGYSFRRDRAAATPSMSGMRTSIRTTSGLHSEATLMASRPLPASPTTSMSPPSASASRSIVLVLEESSTTITRTESPMLVPQGNGSTAVDQYLNGMSSAANRIAGVPIAASLAELRNEIIVCRRCPRLVEWRVRTAREKRASFATWEYWGRTVPGFGDTGARILIVGLAPAAHGGNRTGRIFTGDRSGDFLFDAVYRCGLSNQATSVSAEDGLELNDLYVAAVNRCCPPGNRPTTQERDNCLPYLAREIDLLDRLKVLVALGSFAWVGAYTLIGSFHPSQQNTFTGRLTPSMLEGILRRAIGLAD